MAHGFETRDEAVELIQDRSVDEERILEVCAQQLIEREIGEAAGRDGHHQGVDCDLAFYQVADLVQPIQDLVLEASLLMRPA